MNKSLLFAFTLIIITNISAQVEYPYPVKYFNLSIEKKPVKMAYMDIAPANANGKTIILFHGKNFNGYYWKNLIPVLAEKGYHVIVPDQVGWGRSDKPDLHYSFHMLASNNKALLDSLNINKIIVLGHSMGGMLAARFVLMFPEMVEKLILENPIGLEDYKTFVPYRPLTELYKNELSATYESYKKYQQGYYPTWKPEYEQYVKAQAEPLFDTGFAHTAWANAVTYQMIYEQPVIYEFPDIKVPTLLIIGQEDSTIVGKNLLTDAQKKKHGQYSALGRNAHQLIKDSQLQEIKGVGHIPHLQEPEVFYKMLLGFL